MEIMAEGEREMLGCKDGHIWSKTKKLGNGLGYMLRMAKRCGVQCFGL
jgi:hypothetical protein